jgi:hypothetical protein
MPQHVYPRKRENRGLLQCCHSILNGAAVTLFRRRRYCV